MYIKVYFNITGTLCKNLAYLFQFLSDYLFLFGNCHIQSGNFKPKITEKTKSYHIENEDRKIRVFRKKYFCRKKSYMYVFLKVCWVRICKSRCISTWYKLEIAQQSSLKSTAHKAANIQRRGYTRRMCLFLCHRLLLLLLNNTHNSSKEFARLKRWALLVFFLHRIKRLIMMHHPDTRKRVK